MALNCVSAQVLGDADEAETVRGAVYGTRCVFCSFLP